MAIKISGETVVDDSKKGLFNDVVVKGGAGGSGEITLNCENNSHGVKLKGPAHSAGADYTLTLPNTSGNSGEVLTTDGTGVMSWEEVVGNEISTTAPTNPSVGALWTDTSEDPSTPLLKTWNGSAWVAVGSATPSEFAPVVNNVTLTENDPTGDRFTSQTFDVDIQMLREGNPFTQKGLKGEVTASFEQRPTTEAVASNATTAFPNTIRSSNINSYSSGGYQVCPVWAPGLSEGTYAWYSLYFPSGSGSNGYFYTIDIDSITTPDQLIVSNITFSGSAEMKYGKYFPSTANDVYEYIWFWSDANASKSTFRARRHASSPGAAWIAGWVSVNRPWYDEASGSYYWTEYDYIKRGNYAGNPVAQTSSFGAYDSLGTGMCAVGNGKVVALRNYGTTQYVYHIATNFSEGQSGNLKSFGPSGHEADWIDFVNNYFYVGFSNGSLWRSPDGSSWTEVSIARTDGVSGYYRIDYMDTDPNTNELRAWTTGRITSGGSYNRYIFTSNNNGATWVATWGASKSVDFFNECIPFFGDGKVVFVDKGDSGGSKMACDYYPYSAQTVTLQGTGEGYSELNVGDIIRPAGSTEYEKEGQITSISGADIGLNSPYTYQVGDVIEAKYPTSSGESTRYLIISASGDVTGTIGYDPGYVQVGPDTSQTLTFPATFASGDTPDEELPAGTTIKVSAQATNSEGSSEFGPSNIVTPS